MNHESSRRVPVELTWDELLQITEALRIAGNRERADELVRKFARAEHAADMAEVSK